MSLVMEHKTIAVTGNLETHLDRMSLIGWEHYSTLAGCLDSDGYRPVGVTLFFRKPMEGQVKETAAKSPTNRRA